MFPPADASLHLYATMEHIRPDCRCHSQKRETEQCHSLQNGRRQFPCHCPPHQDSDSHSRELFNNRCINFADKHRQNTDLLIHPLHSVHCRMLLHLRGEKPLSAIEKTRELTPGDFVFFTANNKIEISRKMESLRATQSRLQDAADVYLRSEKMTDPECNKKGWTHAM